MSKKTLILLVILIIAILFGFSLIKKSSGGLIGPEFIKLSKTSPSPTSAPPVAPKTFNFDSSTDLKEELNKINPKVLDSDFE